MNDKPRILFVDDEERLLDGIRRTFKKRIDWDLTFETDPINAVELQKQTAFHAVVTDFKMPGLNGIELAQTLHDIDPNTQIVMLTGAADLNTAAHVINSTKVFRFYTKPCTMDVLEKGLEECLARHNDIKKETASAGIQYSSDVLDRLRIGVLICEKTAKIVYMNQFAAEICAEQKVLSVDGTNNLRAVQAVSRDELLKCLNSSSRDRAMSLHHPDRDHPVSVIVSDLKGQMAGKVMLLLSDPDRHIAPSVEILQSIYDLPPSEAKVLQQIVQGYSLQEAAQKLNITESSARTYLKRVFSKTNTRSQPELIRSVLLTPSLHLSA